MSVLQSIVLGIVQGLTEFLPISSTAHLRIVPAFLGWKDPGAAFTAIVQLGTMAAVLLYFRVELLGIVRGWIGGLRGTAPRSALEYRMGWYLILGTIPVGVFGLIFKDQIETGARDLTLIGTVMIVFGLILLAADHFGAKNRSEETIDAADAGTVGVAQAFALIPGVSRSGATITGGLFRGLNREAAARFSFLLSVPAVVLSGLFELRKAGGANTGVGSLAISTALAFVVGYASIAFLLRYLTSHSLLVFVVYRVALGALVLALVAGGAIS